VLSYVYNRAHAGINYRLRTLAGGRWAGHCRPVVPMFLLTERCNAKCLHCDIWKNRGKEDSPTLDQWKIVVRDLRKWLGPVRVVFSGGEALLKPYTVDLVSYASSLGLSVEILTHGYWEDQSIIEKLVFASPWMITISVDGVGELHSRIRGREKFWERTSRSVETIRRLCMERRLKTVLRLKCVIMSHNLDGVCEVARFANHPGMEVFFQPIEQNYNTPEDSHWWEHTDNWPRDTEKAVKVVEELVQMKGKGFRIANSYEQLRIMIPYFRNPDSLRIMTQSHQAHERIALCSALTTLQFQGNGDVTSCCSQKPVGNVKAARIRDIWECRPQWWKSGCCLDKRLTPAEKQELSLPVVS
jgi:MoaA/NifB/PqqE/SkfB family radical SAM enzyme